MNDDIRFEAWLDAWCTAWYHVADLHKAALLGTGPCILLMHWYQRGVMMGLLAGALNATQLEDPPF